MRPATKTDDIIVYWRYKLNLDFWRRQVTQLRGEQSQWMRRSTLADELGWDPITRILRAKIYGVKIESVYDAYVVWVLGQVRSNPSLSLPPTVTTPFRELKVDKKSYQYFCLELQFYSEYMQSNPETAKFFKPLQAKWGHKILPSTNTPTNIEAFASIGDILEIDFGDKGYWSYHLGVKRGTGTDTVFKDTFIWGKPLEFRR